MRPNPDFLREVSIEGCQKMFDLAEQSKNPRSRRAVFSLANLLTHFCYIPEVTLMSMYYIRPLSEIYTKVYFTNTGDVLDDRASFEVGSRLEHFNRQMRGLQVSSRSKLIEIDQWEQEPAIDECIKAMNFGDNRFPIALAVFRRPELRTPV